MKRLATRNDATVSILGIQLTEYIEHGVELVTEFCCSIRRSGSKILRQQRTNHLASVGSPRNDRQSVRDHCGAEQLDERLELRGRQANRDGRRLPTAEHRGE